MSISISLAYLIFIFYLSLKRPLLALLIGTNGFLVNGIIGQVGGLGHAIVSLIVPLITFFSLLFYFYRKNGRVIFKFELDTILVFSILGLQLLSTVYSNNQILALESSIRYAVFCLSYYVFVKLYFYNCSFPELELRKMLRYVFIIGLVFGIVALIRGESSSDYIMRLSIGNVTSIPLSIIVGQSVAIGLLAFFTRTLLHTKIILITLPILFYILALTNTRSTIIACLIVTIFAVFSGFRLSKRLNPGSLILILVCFLFSTYFYLTSEVTLFERSISGFERLLDGQYGESEGDRLRAWSYALDAFAKDPMLGIGPGNFGQKYISYPHNIYLELLSESGIFSFLALFILTGFCLFKAFTRISLSTFFVCGLFLFSLFISQVSLTLWMHKWLFIWMALALYFSNNYINLKDRD